MVSAGAPPLVFHRDSPYFDFHPSHVVTVWVALDEMHPELGPLEYVRGSHRWGDGRSGSAAQFFDTDARALLRSAAQREGLATTPLGETKEAVTAALKQRMWSPSSSAKAKA